MKEERSSGSLFLCYSERNSQILYCPSDCPGLIFPDGSFASISSSIKYIIPTTLTVYETGPVIKKSEVETHLDF